jgi:histidine triad (HIT) family protein
MPTVFTRIIDGEIPGRFVWRDDRVVAFLTIEPMHPGHTLVVTREEYDHWIDVPPDLNAHLWTVAQTIGRAIDRAFSPRRVGVLVVGDEVPHVHVHVTGFDSLSDLSFANVDRGVSAERFEEIAAALRSALRELGAAGVSE